MPKSMNIHRITALPVNAARSVFLQAGVVIAWSIATPLDNATANTISAIITAILTVPPVINSLNDKTFCFRPLQMGGFLLNLNLSAGWIISSFAHLTVLKYPIDMTLSALGLSAGSYALAIFYASVFSIFMTIISTAPAIADTETKIFSKIISLRSTPISKISLWSLIISIIDIALIMKGIVGQRSINTSLSGTGEIAFYVPFVDMIFSAQVALNALMLAIIINNRKLKSSYSLVLAISFALSLFIFFSKGRLGFIFCLVMHLAWFATFFGRLPKVKSMFILAAVAVPLISNAMVMGNMARNFRVDARTGQTASGLSAAINTATALQDTRVRDEQNKRTLVNLSYRPLVAAPLATAMSHSQYNRDFLGGKYLVNSAVWSIPRVIFPGKVNFENAEVLLASHGIIQSATDTSDSVYLSAYVDFAWFGVIFYPLIIALLWITPALMCLARGPAFSIITISVISYMFATGVAESAVTGWISTTRNIFILFVAFPLVELLLPKKAGQAFMFSRASRGAAPKR
jgi:hypothetical protein